MGTYDCGAAILVPFPDGLGMKVLQNIHYMATNHFFWLSRTDPLHSALSDWEGDGSGHPYLVPLTVCRIVVNVRY